MSSAALALIFASAAASACPAEHARYALRDLPTLTARFIPRKPDDDWGSDVFLKIESRATKRVYWFIPWPGGTSGIDHVTSVAAPDSPPPSPDSRPESWELDFYVLNATYRFTDELPRLGKAAPAHFFIAGLDDHLRHNPDDGGSEAVGNAFFDLVGCDR